MTKTVSVSEAKNTLSAVLDWAVENNDGVVIESRGEPKAVILPYDEYEEYLALREKARRQEALRKLDALAERMRARNADLSPDEANAIADDLMRETIERMIREDKVRFEP